MLVLVLEASTSAAKAMLYDDVRGVIKVVSHDFPHNEAAIGVHDASGIYEAVIRAGREAAGGNDVAAIACGGVWHSIVACDADMRPASKAYLWNFTGTETICRKIRSDSEKSRSIYRRTGCVPNITYQPYTILYLKRNGFKTEDKFFTSQGALFFFNLTGERAETKCMASGMGLLNERELVYDDKIMELCGVRPDQFGKLTDYEDTAPLLKEPAEALGIPSGIPVVPAHSDGALNQVGNGCVLPGRMTLSVGTSAAIRMSCEIPLMSDPPATWCYTGVTGWMAGAATNGACNCINWFRQTVLKDKWSFAELESDMLADSPTPVFVPFLFGERCPGWDDSRRGRFHYLDASDSVPEMFRAISEGVLFNLFQCYEKLTALIGPPETIVLSGGILNSPKWTQMAADIFGKRLYISETPHASMLGGAALALYAAGTLEDIWSFQAKFDAYIDPRLGVNEIYRRKFNQYMACYESEEHFFMATLL